MPAPASVSFTTVLFTISGSLFVHQVLSAATIVAKHTSALCNACRLASSKTSNPVARRQFVQSAKEVANTTANLVKTIKVNSPSDQNVECEFVLFLDQQKVGSAWRICARKGWHELSFQGSDADFSEENRNRCRVATTPLLEAVENLSTFANNPEFASIPAQISNEVFITFRASFSFKSRVEKSVHPALNPLNETILTSTESSTQWKWGTNLSFTCKN